MIDPITAIDEEGELIPNNGGEIEAFDFDWDAVEEALRVGVSEIVRKAVREAIAEYDMKLDPYSNPRALSPQNWAGIRDKPRVGVD